MRLDKFICKSTRLSKAEAIAQIVAGAVRINDVISGAVNGDTSIDQSTQVHANNSVEMDGQVLQLRPFRYIVLHKPAGTICSNADEGYPSVFQLLDIDNVSELHIAGRLDVDTTGMVLITDDGRWTFNITRPNQQCYKVYRVGLASAISEHGAADLVAKFKRGFVLQGESEPTLPALLEIIDPRQVRLSISEGKYHQVKRMFAAVGNKVNSLHREQIGGISLDIGPGQWRHLSIDEVGLFSDSQESIK